MLENLSNDMPSTEVKPVYILAVWLEYSLAKDQWFLPVDWSESSIGAYLVTFIVANYAWMFYFIWNSVSAYHQQKGTLYI